MLRFLLTPWVKGNVTGWLYYMLIIWPFTAIIIYPIALKFVKVGPEFCKFLYKP